MNWEASGRQYSQGLAGGYMVPSIPGAFGWLKLTDAYKHCGGVQPVFVVQRLLLRSQEMMSVSFLAAISPGSSMRVRLSWSMAIGTF